MNQFDVLCVGFACYDLIFTVDHHPGPNEKARASAFLGCGGGTAANAAVAAAQLGASTAFTGYLGNDIYGDQHLAELHAAGVDTRLVVRGAEATSISAIFVKPDGARSIVNYREQIASRLTPADVPFTQVRPKTVLFDGHQPALALAVADWAHAQGIPTVLDADTINDGNRDLVRRCTIVAASEHFAQAFTGADSPQAGMARLAHRHSGRAWLDLAARGGARRVACVRRRCCRHHRRRRCVSRRAGGRHGAGHGVGGSPALRQRRRCTLLH